MSWVVTLKKRVIKGLQKLPKSTREDLLALLVDLEDSGPVRGDWPNYSKLADGRHHCHLSYSYVAVWAEDDKQLEVIEVIYVGSREGAPY